MTGRVSLKDAILKAAQEKVSPAGVKYLSLGLAETEELAGSRGKPLKHIEITALQNNITPERYQRSMGTIGGPEGQATLLSSCVAVIGLGGLGGLAAQLFARMGIGSLVLVDGDNFSDSNLNRQALSNVHNLGKSKADEAACSVKEINPSTEVSPYSCFADRTKLSELLDNVHVTVDCLDNIKTRFELESVCQELKIPLVHGAIAGHMGQIAVIRPGEPLLASIYGEPGKSGHSSSAGTRGCRGGHRPPARDTEEHNTPYSHNSDKKGTGIETILGNPAATPAVIAAWQVSETVKLLLGHKNILQKELLYIDLENNETTRLPLKPL